MSVVSAEKKNLKKSEILNINRKLISISLCFFLIGDDVSRQLLVSIFGPTEIYLALWIEKQSGQSTVSVSNTDIAYLMVEVGSTTSAAMNDLQNIEAQPYRMVRQTTLVIGDLTVLLVNASISSVMLRRSSSDVPITIRQSTLAALAVEGASSIAVIESRISGWTAFAGSTLPAALGQHRLFALTLSGPLNGYFKSCTINVDVRVNDGATLLAELVRFQVS